MMNNKKTLLFTFFTISFILLFDSWQRFNGHPSFFMANFNNAAGNNQTTNLINKNIPDVTQNSNVNVIAANDVPQSNVQNSAPVDLKPIILKTDIYEVEISPIGGSITNLK